MRAKFSTEEAMNAGPREEVRTVECSVRNLYIDLCLVPVKVEKCQKSCTR